MGKALEGGWADSRALSVKHRQRPGSATETRGWWRVHGDVERGQSEISESLSQVVFLGHELLDTNQEAFPMNPSWEISAFSGIVGCLFHKLRVYGTSRFSSAVTQMSPSHGSGLQSASWPLCHQPGGIVTVTPSGSLTLIIKPCA